MVWTYSHSSLVSAGISMPAETRKPGQLYFSINQTTPGQLCVCVCVFQHQFYFLYFSFKLHKKCKLKLITTVLCIFKKCKFKSNYYNIMHFSFKLHLWACKLKKLILNQHGVNEVKLLQDQWINVWFFSLGSRKVIQCYFF